MFYVCDAHLLLFYLNCLALSSVLFLILRFNILLFIFTGCYLNFYFRRMDRLISYQSESISNRSGLKRNGLLYVDVQLINCSLT